MKKIVGLFLSLCLIFLFTACNQSVTTSSNSNIISSNTGSNIISNPQNTEDIEVNNPTMGEATNTISEISEELFTKSDDKKTFNEGNITLTVPIDWECKVLSGEDGKSYFFRNPKLDKKCELSFGITFTELFTGEFTEEEYLEYLTFDKRENVKIDSFTKGKVGGYKCRKVVSSYLFENTEYIRVDYNYVIVGFRLYNFIIEYPASQHETFETIFNSIINSIEFKTE